MIIVRAPVRISFVGGGSDLPDFYHFSPGRVISATVDKYVYVVINHTPLLKGITARYSITENTNSVEELKNDRIRESLLHLGIKDNIEIGIFSHIKTGMGLGGSSSFTVALIKGLSTYLGKRLDNKDVAEMAFKIEAELIKEPVGKQDQYASAYGGFNIFQFNPSGVVNVEPVFLDFKKRLGLENHMILFFMGITRLASSVLSEQKTNISKKIETLQTMAKLVDVFRNKLMKGDFETLGKLLHENWIKKKMLASNISNSIIDELYESGIKAGAWGGKVLGAGGGGCLLFFIHPEKKEKIRNAMKRKSKIFQLSEFREIPIKFIHTGVEIVSNSFRS